MTQTTDTLTVAAPLSGTVIPITAVPDPVFAMQMVGTGLAVSPATDAPIDVVAPITGTIVKLHPHAFVIVDADGRGVLTHVGIDTVRLDGAGFELFAAQGDTVSAGTLIVRVDPAQAVAAGYSLISPVVVLDSTSDSATAQATGEIGAGSRLFAWSPA